MPKRPGKLLYLVNNDWFFLSHRLHLTKAAQQNGFQIVVATRINRDDAGKFSDAERITNEGFRLYPLRYYYGDNLNPFKELAALIEISLLYLRERPSLVHHISLKTSLTGSVAAWLTRIPMVVNTFTGLGVIFNSRSVKGKLLQRIIQWVLRLVLSRKRYRLIFQNQHDMGRFLNSKVADKSHMILIRGSGVDTNKFKVTPLPGEIPLIMFASRMLWDKGAGDFIEAANILKKRNIPCRFVLVGKPDPGNPRSIPQEIIDQWVNEGTVEWWGHRDSMHDVLPLASIVCLPTYYGEGLPKILLEAASCGRPIVATDIPGCLEIVQDGINGYACPIKSPERIADALIKLVQDKNLCESMGLAGRKLVESELTIEHVVEKTMDIYTTLHER